MDSFYQAGLAALFVTHPTLIYLLIRTTQSIYSWEDYTESILSVLKSPEEICKTARFNWIPVFWTMPSGLLGWDWDKFDVVSFFFGVLAVVAINILGYFINKFVDKLVSKFENYIMSLNKGPRADMTIDD